jgi:regulator of protease activity HflC (stomatin/prohibitin superfamily)
MMSVVITQFGKLVGKTHKVPGEYFKIPFIQKSHYFKKYIILLEETHEIPTWDKKFLTIKLKAQWKVNDPAAFYKNFNSSKLSKAFISDEVGKAARQIVTSHKSDEQIFQVINSDSDKSAFCPYFELEIKKMAEDEISKAGSHLVHVGVEIT